MPQIWLTYQEAGELLECLPTIARVHSIARGWDRRKSQDGQTRIKLPPQETQLFLDRYVAARLPVIETPPLLAQALPAQITPQETRTASSDWAVAPADNRLLLAGLFS